MSFKHACKNAFGIVAIALGALVAGSVIEDIPGLYKEDQKPVKAGLFGMKSSQKVEQPTLQP